MVLDKKNKLYFIESSYVYGDVQVRLPYSTGLIWSYCKLNKTIIDNYEFGDILFARTTVEDFVDRLDNPTIIGFSCFVWNWAFNNEVAKIVKEKYPDCLIVYGGQHQPTVKRLKYESDFFEKHPYVDILVHGEGELTFEDILLENIKDKDWSKVDGISYQIDNNKFINNKTRIRVGDVDSMPSPYLDGVMDKYVERYKDKYSFTTTIESVRGCPYRCTYCEIGDLYFQKIKPQSIEKLKKEFNWMSANKVVYIDNADSNFGLYADRDLEIAKTLVHLKKTTGYPTTFRNDWAKDRGEQCIPIAKVLSEGNMNKGLTMALQSLNPKTLEAVKRKNIVSKDIEGFLQKCKDVNLAVYAEIIIGLPEETLDSLKDGIIKLIEFGAHNYVGLYPLSILPNTPFGDPEYIKKYGIKYTKTKALHYHITETEVDESEEEKIAIETNTMSRDEMLKAHEFRWFMMINHFFGLTQFVARFLNNHSNIRYKEFYDKLYQYFSDNPKTVLGKEMKEFNIALKKVFTEKRHWGWLLDDKRTWEFDEGSVVRIWKNIDRFYTDIKFFVMKSNLIKDIDVLDTVIDYQQNSLIQPDKKYPYKKFYPYNIKDVIEENKPLQNGGYIYKIDGMYESKNYNGDYLEWCRDLYWWGRKEGRYKSKLEVCYD